MLYWLGAPIPEKASAMIKGVFMVLGFKTNERELHKESKLLILSIFPIAFLLFSLLLGESLSEMYEGIIDIVLSPTLLVTDFLELGGVSAAFFNASVIGFFNIYLLKRFKLRINGLLIAAFMTVLGFSFFGKNIINIIPLYIGGFLYAKYQNIKMRDVILVTMFSTALAPLVSQIIFGGIIDSPYNYGIGVTVGVLIGFIIVPLSSHMLKFHDGFNLYNIGFTAGIIGTLFTSILKSFDRSFEPVSLIYSSENAQMFGMLIFLFLLLIGLGIIINPRAVIDYKHILKYRGRTITDFTHLLGYGITFVNMGLMGLLSVLYVYMIKGVINGPVLAGIFTIVGFAAFGKHPKNCFSVALGVILAALLMQYDLSSTGMIISVMFSTTLAPIAGTYGVIAGAIAGMLHMAVVTNIGVIHGGVNLYNNGFSGGLVAGILVPVIEAFKKEG